MVGEQARVLHSKSPEQLLAWVRVVALEEEEGPGFDDRLDVSV
jgi:hypothetical protein